MRFKRVSVVFFLQAMIWLMQEACGFEGYCAGRTSVVSICKDSRKTKITKVFIDTADVPEHRNNTCSCKISPVSSVSLNGQVILTFRKYPSDIKDVYFKFHEHVLKKTIPTVNTTLKETNELILETTSDFNITGVCVSFSSKDNKTQFNISCEDPERHTEMFAHMTTLQTTLFTNTTDKPKTSSNSRLENSGVDTTINASDDKCVNISCEKSTSDVTESTETSAIPTTLVPKPTSASEGNSENDDSFKPGMTEVIISSAVGTAVVLIVLQLLIKIIRTAMKKKKNERTIKKHVVAERNDEDESDYYNMTENPMYDKTEPEARYYNLMNKNLQFVQSIEENYENSTAAIYDLIPDSPNDVGQHLTSFETTHEKNIDGAKNIVDTAEYTEVGQVEKIDISAQIYV